MFPKNAAPTPYNVNSKIYSVLNSLIYNICISHHFLQQYKYLAPMFI
jgi:hypothetical protein